MRRSRSRSSGMASAERRGRAQFAVLAVSLGVFTPQPTSAQLLVDPLQVTIGVAGPGTALSSLSLSNTSDKPVQVSITRGDWDRAENGDNRFFPGGSTPHSCGRLLSVSPPSVRLEPHTSRVVRLAVQADSLLTRECWDIVFVEELPQRTATKGNSLEFTFRTGVKVYIGPPGLPRHGVVEGMAVVDSPKPAIAIRFHNTGGTHLLAKGRLEFRRVDNSLASQVEIGDFPTLPGALRRVVVNVPSDLPPGVYIVLALIDFGGAELVAGQIDFQAK
ncbi:MAG: molecular chaperone [Gemmatimonadaceae bacterium]